MVHLPRQDLLQLSRAIANALGNSFKNLKDPEPQLIANLVWHLPEQLKQIQFTGGTSIKAGGVFVHARPFVTSPSFPNRSPKSVEIGDLLLIRTTIVGNTITERRALILQAKKTDRIPAVPNNANQWHLYEKWPQFKYARRSGSLKGYQRHVIEPDMYEAAKYLLIGTAAGASHPTCQCMQYTAQPTRQALSRYRCFFGELLEFFTGDSGKSVIGPAPGTYGWDQVIHDLINETANAKTIFMGRAANQSSKRPRGKGFLFVTYAHPSNYFIVAGRRGTQDFDDLPPDKPPEVPAEWSQSGSGISIIEIVVEQE